MDLVKLEIDGKRIIADNRLTILEVARQHGIHSIPTLCHDEQLEPFASCFVCVVKVKGARTLLPACSTRVAPGMVVETDNAEIRRARKASLELMLSNHYADCIGPCQLNCPAGIDIQGYIALAALGQYSDAIRLIKDRNPLPAVCGRVCTRPCEVKGCRRNLLDEAVGIDYIKRYIADLDLGREKPWRPEVASPNGHQVAVVGAGPAGLSCAYYLAIRGYAVQMFEGLPEAGGMLRYGIPEYRLPKEVLDLEIKQILDLGVQLSTNVVLGRDFTVTSLKEQGFQAVFLGIGAWDSSKMRVQDEETDGVLPGIDFLKEYGLNRSTPLKGRVLVVGGGNTAIDCARTALRLGADEVRLLYRRTRTEMPANEMEIVEAEHEGIQMDFLVAPVRVIQKNGRVAQLECLRMELGEPDASGRRSPKPIRGSEFTYDCDYVLAAIGQSTQVKQLVDGRVPGFLPLGEALNLTRWQTIQVNDRTFETSVEGVFSGGDVVTGAATAIEAIAAGRKAAYAIDSYIRTGQARPEPLEFCSRKDVFRQVTTEDLREGARYPRREMPAIPIEERIRGFSEVETGYSAEDVHSETARCLECGCVALFDCKLREYGTEYQVDLTNFLGEATQYRIDRRHPLIELDPNKCILCGRCVRICSEVVGVAAYGFINRGFSTVVKPALGEGLLETDCVTCGLCIGTCPTGAITEKSQLAKPGPWPTRQSATVCTYCGTGCRFSYDTFGDSLVKVSRLEAPSATSGNHCRSGRFGYHYIQDSARLREARLRHGTELRKAGLEEAIAQTAARLKELRGKYAPSEFAVLVSPRLTNEELYLAQKFARVALGTNQVASLANLVNPEFFAPEVVSTISYRDLEKTQAVVVVNSELSDEHFVVDLAVKKAIRQGAKVIYIGPRENHVSRFADVFLRCQDGTQAQVMLGLLAHSLQGLGRPKGSNGGSRDSAGLPQGSAGLLAGHDQLGAALAALDRGALGLDAELSEASAILTQSAVKAVVFNKDYRGARVPGDDRIFSEIARVLGCSILALREKSNMQGLLDMGAHPDWLCGYASSRDEAALAAFEKEWCVSLGSLRSGPTDLAARLRAKEIKVAIVLGEDPAGLASFPADLTAGIHAAEFLVVGDLFLTPTARLAHVVLPLSSAAETSGTMTNQERRVQSLTPAIPPVAGMETWQILCRLAGQMGYRFKIKYNQVSEIQDEIRQVFPEYAVQVDSPDPGGTWDLSGLRLPPVPPAYGQVGRPADPVATRELDHLEHRFRTWFDTLYSRALAAREAELAQIAK